MHGEQKIFINHLLEKRLKRVPTDVLRKFLETIKDTKELKTQRRIVDEIINQYKILNQNKDFIYSFNNFIRDYVLSAKESDYLLALEEHSELINWIMEWENNRFVGQNYYFSVHIYTKLEEKYLVLNDDKTAFPTEVILMIAQSKTSKYISSGMDLIEFYPISEFEIIFRKGLSLIEVRGQNNVIKDFIYSAILDDENPLSMSNTIFIGENQTVYNSRIKPKRNISIDKLKISLEGTYESLSGPVGGKKTLRMKADVNELNSSNEETDPNLKIILDSLMNNQDKSSISFKYKEKKYSFDATKSGGLFFKKYAPEEVITYVISKIKNLSGDFEK